MAKTEAFSPVVTLRWMKYQNGAVVPYKQQVEGIQTFFPRLDPAAATLSVIDYENECIIVGLM